MSCTPRSADRNPLRKRLAALRRRLHFVVTVRAVGWLLTILLLTAAAAGLAAVVLAGSLLFLFPTHALTALARRADPFGGHGWPHTTFLDLDPHRGRIGSNEVFEVRGSVRGVLPEKVDVAYQVGDTII